MSGAIPACIKVSVSSYSCERNAALSSLKRNRLENKSCDGTWSVPVGNLRRTKKSKQNAGAQCKKKEACENQWKPSIYDEPCQRLVRNRGDMKSSLFLLFLGLLLAESQGIGVVKRRVKLLRNMGMLRRMAIGRQELKPKICYDLVGCFADPPPHLSLKRPPEPPNVIQTRFHLFTRKNPEIPENLSYGDNSKSITSSNYNVTRPLKVGIHGYKGSASDAGTLMLARTLLDLEDANVLLPDWTRGAATTYQAAVANTELVGRQLALILLDTITMGTDPDDIHIIGFSLGAHVAGCASEALKKNNILVGRITGLDPASPFFRHHLFRERSRKLDATDAELVDIIHTDGSEDFADGFGLLKPIGHVDFFPNGGREQPGCVDVKNSVVVSHLKEDALDRAIACSHLRAFRLFIETIKAQKSECKFIAWPCAQGAIAYQRGVCFPYEGTEWAQEMGYGANRGPPGIYYLATRGEAPFCGQPMRAVIRTLEGAPRTSGVLFIKMLQGNSTTLFKIRCTLARRRNDALNFYNIAAAEFDTVTSGLSTLTALVWYEVNKDKEEDSRPRDQGSVVLFLKKLGIEDRKGNRWEHCSENLEVNYQHTLVKLQSEPCY